MIKIAFDSIKALQEYANLEMISALIVKNDFTYDSIDHLVTRKDAPDNGQLTLTQLMCYKLLQQTIMNSKFS